MANFLGKILDKKEPIKIGHLTPLSGEYARFGEWEKEGVDLAVEEINKKGGINGQKIVILREDDRLDPALDQALLGRMIDVQKIQAVVGSPSSDVVLAGAPIIDKNKITMITALAGSTKITAASKYLFRIYPQTTQEGEQLAIAASRAGYKKAVVIYINNSYGIELAKSVKRKASEFGIEILAMEGYRQETADFKDQLSRVKEKNPEVIFLMGYPRDMGLILKQAGELQFQSKYLAPDTFWDPDLLAIASRATEDIAYVIPEINFAPDFILKFKKRYKNDPNVFHVLCYDALNLLALAIGRGGYNGTAIRDELFKIKDYQGASGIITFDENGDAINRPLELRTVEGRKVVPYPKEAKP
jgi:branched-chain amino acid transport system substrate-binding protein